MASFKLSNGATITLTVEDGRLKMSGPSGGHGVAVRYDLTARRFHTTDLDRAAIHLAGYLSHNGATLAEASKIIARFVTDPDLGTWSGRHARTVGALGYGMVRSLHDLKNRRPARLRSYAGISAAGMREGHRLARLVAWHLGVSHARTYC